MPTPARLSLCVITLNEASNVEACLESARFCDEVVVLDSGSTDDTAARARALGAKVAVEPFRGFGPQKNRCFELASGEWLLSLDADERVTPELAAEIRAAVDAPGDAAAFDFPRRNLVAGRSMPRGGPFHNWPDPVVRLLRRGRARCHDRAVHESMVVEGRVGHLRGVLEHHAYPSYEAMRRAMDRYASLGAWRAFDELGGEAAARGRRRPWRATFGHAALRAAATFAQKWLLRGGFLDGAHGLQGSVAAASYVFSKYGKLTELWDRAAAGEALEGARRALLAPPPTAAADRRSDDGSPGNPSKCP